ncbi:hypothetical protein AC1031_013308 [Aphanomyces cochlioides]|nr:hypothetical protein AC1031_013308 [Aphanomyces cochlioides]
MRWDFDAGLETDHFRQVDMLQTMFGILGAHSLFEISFEIFNELLNDVKCGYNCVPGLPSEHRYYHNFAHALDVTQTLFAMFHFLEETKETISPIEKVVILVAAIGHDIGHPGVSNHYIMVAKHALTIEYGDDLPLLTPFRMSDKPWGVLERMHAAETKRLVLKYNLFSNQSPTSQIHLERLLMMSILNTDMSQHDGLLKHVNEYVCTPIDKLSDQTKIILCSFLLHCADLSNGAKPWQTSNRWAHLVMKEFFAQGEAEKKNGMPISPNCDAMTTMIPELQIKFINFAVLPCFSLLQTLFPPANLAVSHALENIRHWENKRDTSLTLEQRVIIRAISMECHSVEWINDIQNTKGKDESTKRYPEFDTAKYILKSPFYILVLVATSILIIFEPSLRRMSSHGTEKWNYVLSSTLAIYAIDIMLCTFADPRYLLGFYFWFDVASLASLLLEQVNVGQGWYNLYLVPAIVQPRMVRLGRVIRSTYYLPLQLSKYTRFLKSSDATGMHNDRYEEFEPNVVFQSRDISKLFTRLASKNVDAIDQEQIEKLVNEAYNGVDIPTDAVNNVMAYFISPTQPNSSIRSKCIEISREAFSRGIRQMELKYEGKIDAPTDTTPQQVKRMVGRELSDIVIQRIMILVLMVLLVIPQLNWKQVVQLDKYHYALMDLHRFSLFYNISSETDRLPSVFTSEVESMIIDMKPFYLQIYNVSPVLVLEAAGQTVNTDYQSLSSFKTNIQLNLMQVVQVSGCATNELNFVLDALPSHAEICISTAIFNLTTNQSITPEFSVLTTGLIFVCVISSIIYLDFETYGTVIQPIQSMLKVVQGLSTNPAKKIRVQDRESRNEILQLQNTLIKIASLIQIGFGDAGAEILARNILAGDLNPVAPGKKVYAIFGFCSIRNFSKATEILKEEIMQYTNQIGDVVHESVHTFGGHANKNIGQAFLLVWKVLTTSIEASVVSGSQVPQHMSPKKNTLLSVMESDSANLPSERMTVADRALVSFLKIQIDIMHSPALIRYHNIFHDPEGKQPMGFGLHVGWAIEGAIGSRHKIDASYLSPDVNMSARLEAATKQLGVTILMSHTFHKLLSQKVQDMCRLIDCVTVKGSEKPLSLYTFDVCNGLEPKHVNLGMLVDHNCNFNDGITALQELQMDMPTEFRSTFDTGVSKYLEGRWCEAKALIEQALLLLPEDGPSLCLLRVMKENNYQAPVTWGGYRILKEK